MHIHIYNSVCVCISAQGYEQMFCLTNCVPDHHLCVSPAAIPPPKEAEATHVVCLTNLLTDSELQDPQEADDVLEDTRDKCEDVSCMYVCVCVCVCVCVNVYICFEDVLEDTRGMCVDVCYMYVYVCVCVCVMMCTYALRMCWKIRGTRVKM